jgi:hypothetical protein
MTGRPELIFVSAAEGMEMSSRITDALPDRAMSRNELYAIESGDGIRITMPETAPWDDDVEQIECFMIVGDGATVAVGFDDEAQSWNELHRESTPKDAFTGEYITNEDHDHPEIRRIMDTIEDWEK